MKTIVMLIGVAACSSKSEAPKPAPAPVAAEVPKSVEAPKPAPVEAPPPEPVAKVKSMSDEDVKKLDEFIASDAPLAFTKLQTRPDGEAADPTKLSSQEISASIKARSGLLKACYQKELDRRPTLKGTVTVSFEIGADGKPGRVTIDKRRTTLDDAAVQTCVVAQFKRMEFPPKGPAKVTYPIVFAEG